MRVVRPAFKLLPQRYFSLAKVEDFGKRVRLCEGRLKEQKCSFGAG